MKGATKRVDLRKTMFLLPNVITLSSIFCGFDAIRLLATSPAPSTGGDEDYYRASILLVFAMLFDMLDGRVARLTHTQSAFGLQIDSLADVISFGVAPALLVYKWSLHQLGTAGTFTSFLFCGMAAVRLARFNVLSMGDKGKPTRPGRYIVGLPVPAAAGVLVSLILANHAVAGESPAARHAWPMALVTLLLSFFMVSSIRFRSFKDLRLNVRSVGLVVLVVGSAVVVSVQARPAFVLTWVLFLYVLTGVIEAALGVARRRVRAERIERHPNFPPGS